MAPSYKITYFNMTGRAEPSRMILSYAGIPFEDYRFEKDDWPKIKPTTPFGQVPVLEVDGKKLTQGIPISRYLANITNLAGKNNEENYEIEAAVNIIMEILYTAYDSKFDSEEPRTTKLNEQLRNMIPKFLSGLEENAKKNGGYLATTRITWADIVFLCGLEDMRNIVENKDFLADYPNLKRVKKNLLAVKNLRDYIQKRPTIPMSVFDLKSEL